MTKLLCAIMIGSQCVSWFPRGTKKTDIAGYGVLIYRCVPDDHRFEECKKPEEPEIAITGFKIWCKRTDSDNPDTLRIFKKYPFGTTAEYACTRKEFSVAKRKRKYNLMSDLQKQYCGPFVEAGQ